MSNLSGAGGLVTFTVDVKRAATGKTEQYKVTGRIPLPMAEDVTPLPPTATTPLQLEFTETTDHGSHPQHRRT